MTWRTGPTLASESVVAAPGFTRCRAQNSMRGRCQVSNPRGNEDGQQADEDALQGGRGNPAEARRFFGCEANGMGGRRMLRCSSRARREYRVRPGLDCSSEWLETRSKATAGASNQYGCSGEFQRLRSRANRNGRKPRVR